MKGTCASLLAITLLTLAACSSGDSDSGKTKTPSAQPAAGAFSGETQALDKARSVDKIIQQGDQKLRKAVEQQSR